MVDEKVVPIVGDIEQEGLGISKEDTEIITENVNIMFNSAASIMFNNPLKQALNINFFSTVRMMELAKKCKNFEVFSHVSTVGVNTD